MEIAFVYCTSENERSKPFIWNIVCACIFENCNVFCRTCEIDICTVKKKNNRIFKCLKTSNANEKKWITFYMLKKNTVQSTRKVVTFEKNQNEGQVRALYRGRGSPARGFGVRKWWRERGAVDGRRQRTRVMCATGARVESGVRYIRTAFAVFRVTFGTKAHYERIVGCSRVPSSLPSSQTVPFPPYKHITWRTPIGRQCRSQDRKSRPRVICAWFCWRSSSYSPWTTGRPNVSTHLHTFKSLFLFELLGWCSKTPNHIWHHTRARYTGKV